MAFGRHLVPAALIVLWSACPTPGRALQVEPDHFAHTGRFAAPELTESSGVAVSRTHPGILWTHNDSGHEPLLYVTNLRGDDLGRIRVTGARSVDWEDLALGPCPASESPCLYIADTGDNLERRKQVTIYIVPEPESLPPVDSTVSTAPARALTVVYPDGPHDVEALAVAPDGEISLITKGRGGVVQRYRVRITHADGDSALVQPAETLAVLPPTGALQQVTAAAISPDGRLLAIRTYTQIIFLRREADGGLRLSGPTCLLGLRQLQGEALDFLDNHTLVLTSESAFGRQGGISTVRCPLESDR